MDNAELYPEGWRHRKFFGSRKAKDKNKKPRMEENIVEEIMQDMENERIEAENRHTSEIESMDLPASQNASSVGGGPDNTM